MSALPKKDGTKVNFSMQNAQGYSNITICCSREYSEEEYRNLFIKGLEEAYYFSTYIDYSKVSNFLQSPHVENIKNDTQYQKELTIPTTLKGALSIFSNKFRCDFKTAVHAVLLIGIYGIKTIETIYFNQTLDSLYEKDELR